MDSAAEKLIREAFDGSAAGTLHFGQVIGLMQQAGVDSYTVDYRARRTAYYRPNGDVLEIPMHMPELPVRESLDAEALKTAIRGSQQGLIQYPQFKQLSAAAGCIGYVVWIAGRRVMYFGRKGETHVELFPD